MRETPLSRGGWSAAAVALALACFAPLFPALVALAPLRLDEAVEVVLAVVVGDLVARRDVLQRRDENLTLHDVGFGIRPARMVDVARDVAACSAVDGPAA